MVCDRYLLSGLNKIRCVTFTKLELIFKISGCNCYENGSNGIACDANGVCSCKANFMNDKCDACNVGFFNFPTCEGNQYINPTSIRPNP